VIPWQEKTWGIPPQADAEFVARLAELLEWYPLPYDPPFPVVGRDAMPKQLIAETRIPWPVCEGHPVRYDDEYERKGVGNLVVFVEPLRGWRKVFVRDRRTQVDWAACVRMVLDQIYPRAIRVRWVQDTLNPPTMGALYAAFVPEEARRLARRLEIHPTPRHGSWLNMAETELAVLDRQCLDRRLDATQLVRQEVRVWETQRNAAKVPINWRFTIADARVKLNSVYPSIKN
jgi:hypothetical protein